MATLPLTSAGHGLKVPSLRGHCAANEATVEFQIVVFDTGVTFMRLSFAYSRRHPSAFAKRFLLHHEISRVQQ
jgi:hypothetical protein